jgi:hypothetical protein
VAQLSGNSGFEPAEKRGPTGKRGSGQQRALNLPTLTLPLFQVTAAQPMASATANMTATATKEALMTAATGSATGSTTAAKGI